MKGMDTDPTGGLKTRTGNAGEQPVTLKGMSPRWIIYITVLSIRCEEYALVE